MTTALITRREAAELSGTSETTVKKAVDLARHPVAGDGVRSRASSPRDVPVLTMLGHLTGVRSCRRAQAQPARAGCAQRTPRRSWSLMPGLVVRKLDDVEQRASSAERYVRLRDQWIVSDPEIKGGEPVIKGSRVSVHTLAARVAEGESEAILDEDFPHIPAEAREVAVVYARANPRRGRPRRASGVA